MFCGPGGIAEHGVHVHRQGAGHDSRTHRLRTSGAEHPRSGLRPGEIKVILFQSHPCTDFSVGQAFVAGRPGKEAAPCLVDDLLVTESPGRTVHEEISRRVIPGNKVIDILTLSEGIGCPPGRQVVEVTPSAMRPGYGVVRGSSLGHKVAHGHEGVEMSNRIGGQADWHRGRVAAAA